jgi:hypothetical protein
LFLSFLVSYFPCLPFARLFALLCFSDLCSPLVVRYAYGPTLEWGFLFEIMQRPEVAKLVDEVYIELHFHFPSLYWKHYHSNWEALDTFRYLRSHGVVVHSWP